MANSEALQKNHYISKTRNKLIALMFKECGLIEKYGSGIDRIKRLCKEHRLTEPKFEEMQKGFRVTVYKETTQKTTQETEKPLSTKEKILELVEKNNRMTRIELAKLTGVSENAIKQHLANLKKEGRLERMGSTKSGYWMVKR